MDKTQALHAFWSGFQIPAIDEQSSYDESVTKKLNLDYPYITYEAAVGELGDSITLNADIYYRSTSWAEIEQKAAEIYDAIGYGGTFVPYDGGAIWIKRRNPAYQRMGEDNDLNVRRIHYNINAEFLSV